MAWIFRHRAPDGSLDTNTTQKVVGISLSIVTIMGYLLAFAGAGVVKFFTDKTLEPTARWLDGFDSILLFLAAMLGIAGGVTWAKRATIKADMAEVAARQASGVAATPPAEEGKNLPRNAAPAPTVPITQESSAAAEAPPRSVPLTDVAAVMNRQPSKTDDES